MPLEHEVDARPGNHGWVATAAAVVRLAILALALAVLLPIHLLSGRVSAPPSRAARLYLRIARRLLRLRYSVDGPPIGRGPALLVSNHVSWADIFVLGSAFRASFVAKADVKGWPVLGWLIGRHGTIFVDRSRPSSAGRQRDTIADRLGAGGSVILFPEGTSSDGRRVLPFKTALFASVGSSGAAVQPVTIQWTFVGGRPIGDGNRLTVAWIDDMLLLPHLWELLRTGGAEARLICHPAVTGSDRRLLAERSYDYVAAGLEG